MKMEIRAAVIGLVGVLIGGVLQLAGSFVLSQSTKDKEYATERRQKIEGLITDAFKVNKCLLSQINPKNTDGECSKDSADYRMLAYVSLYLPELKDPVGEYLRKVIDARKKLIACPAESKQPLENIKHLECIEGLLMEDLGGVEMQKLSEAAGKLAKELH
jgi:hypothetical protein